MRRLKLSPSIIEAFRKARLYDNPVEEIISLLTGEYKPNKHTSLGTAYHSIIQHGESVGTWDDGLFNVYEAEFSALWAFEPKAVEAALAFRDKYRMVHEVKASLEFETRGRTIVSPMRVDGIQGALIHEIKTKTGQAPDYESYLASVQWRMYLSALPNANRVLYTVFELKPNKKDERIIGLKEVHQYAFQRCKSDDSYIHENVNELLHFCELHGLLGHLEA